MQGGPWFFYSESLSFAQELWPELMKEARGTIALHFCIKYYKTWLLWETLYKFFSLFFHTDKLLSAVFMINLKV